MTRRENLVYAVLVLFTTLLFADRYMLYGIILLALAFLLLSGRKLVLYKNLMLTVFIAIGVVAMIDMVLGYTGVFSAIFSSVVTKKEIYRVIIYIIIMELTAIITVDIKTYSRVWRVLLTFIVAVAVIQFTKVIDVDTILKNIYGDSVQFYNSAHTEISSFRCGSVFVNPNVFACFLVAMLGNYMFILQFMKETLLMKVVTFGLIITGFILAGSRTGFILGLIILVVYIYLSSHRNIGEFLKKLFFVVASAAILISILVFFFDVNLSNFSALRLFKLGEGTSNSFAIKVGIFTNLLKNMSVGNMLVGYGPFNYAANNGVLLVDFDFGYFITFFGFCGFFIYIAFLRAIFCWGNRRNYGRCYMNTVFLLIAIIFGFTAGVYFNLRIFSVYMLMFMPKICMKNKIVA